MIEIRIKTIAEEKGYKNAYALQKALNCSPTLASRLWKSDFSMISVETLDKLCYLFNSSSSDLISYRRIDGEFNFSSNLQIKNKLSYVYLMRDTTNGLIKIGYSSNVTAREKTLQSEKPAIELLNYWVGTREDEKILHRLFKNKRIRGEWFEINNQELTQIKNYFSK